jgi:hypothetical protein
MLIATGKTTYYKVLNEKYLLEFPHFLFLMKLIELQVLSEITKFSLHKVHAN